MPGGYDPNIHHRHSIRLTGYDYASEGAYFVTICAQQRLCLFGAIADDQMELNVAGEMVARWWHILPSKFPSVELDVYVVMPNHFHGVMFVHAPGEHTSSPLPIINAVGADPRVGPIAALGEHVGSPLPTIIQWFKTMTTNEYIRGVKQLGWPSFPGKLWQRSYYDHVVRDEEDLMRIRHYIINNPAKWALDEENQRP